MGLLDDSASIISRRSSHHHRSSSKKRDRSRSRARSFFGLDNSSHHSHRHGSHRGSSTSRHHHHHSSSHNNHNRSTASFFSLPNVSSRSIFSAFGGGGGHSHSHGHTSSSYYRRSPRSSFLHRTYRKLKRLLRDLLYYAKKHPLKVFMLAIMPLITGGALTALLARFGMRLPPSIERMLGMGARAVSGDSIGLVGDAMRMAAGAGAGAGAGATTQLTQLERGRNGNLQWERRRVKERDYFGGGGGGGSSNASYYSRGGGYAGSGYAGSGYAGSGYGSDYYARRTVQRGNEDEGWGTTLTRLFY